jgi:pimeloyl-ACP methyl ester carboxylesterase
LPYRWRASRTIAAVHIRDTTHPSAGAATEAVAQDLRVLTRPWGFELGAITVPTSIHHGQADTTVPSQHARLLAEAIPGARLRLYPGHGHFSILGAARQILAPSLDRAAPEPKRPQPGGWIPAGRGQTHE